MTMAIDETESVGSLCHGVTAIYGYGDWYIPSIGNDKALAISNLKLTGQTGTRILKTATIEKISKLLSFCTYR